MEDMARETPRIYELLYDHQVDHQSTMVEVEGKIAKQSIFALNDSRSSHSYITLKVVENCSLERNKHSKSWIVQLATRIKKSE